MISSERPNLSPEHISWIATRIPIQQVEHLGTYEHSHLSYDAMKDLKDSDLVPIDTESCKVELWPGIDEKTKEVQKFALAKLPCGHWIYWEGRE